MTKPGHVICCFVVLSLSPQAFEFYNRALRCLAERKKSPEVWDTVTWELSGSYYSMGTLLQDYAPLSSYAQEQVKDCTYEAVHLVVIRTVV